MTDSKETYRIADAEQRKRIQEFEQIENPTDRRAELAQARALLESAINSGSTTVATSILNTIDRIARSQFKQDLIQHHLLTAPAVRRFGDRIVEILAEIAPKYCEEWEDFLGEVSENLDAAFNELKNDARDIEALRLPR